MFELIQTSRVWKKNGKWRTFCVWSLWKAQLKGLAKIASESERKTKNANWQNSMLWNRQIVINAPSKGTYLFPNRDIHREVCTCTVHNVCIRILKQERFPFISSCVKISINLLISKIYTSLIQFRNNLKRQFFKQANLWIELKVVRHLPQM